MQKHSATTSSSSRWWQQLRLLPKGSSYQDQLHKLVQLYAMSSYPQFSCMKWLCWVSALLLCIWCLSSEWAQLTRAQFLCTWASFLHSHMVPVRPVREAVQSVAKGDGRCPCAVKNTYFLKWKRAQAYPKPLPVFATRGNFLRICSGPW